MTPKNHTVITHVLSQADLSWIPLGSSDHRASPDVRTLDANSLDEDAWLRHRRSVGQQSQAMCLVRVFAVSACRDWNVQALLL